MKRFFFLILFSLFLYGCNSIGDEKVHVMVDHSYEEVPQTLAEVVNSSDVIVKGTFNELKDKINMIRKGDDPTVPADEVYSEGHVYEFETVKTYKGEVPNLIDVAISYGSEIQVVDEKGNNIGKVFVESLEYAELKDDYAYILFLVDSSIAENLYTRASILYLIEIDDDEDVHFISKRMSGELSDHVKTDDNHYAKYTTQYREDFAADIIQEVGIVNNYLKDERISNLNELEKWLAE